MNEVSIIINGVRYDKMKKPISHDRCATCSLSVMCFNLGCIQDFCDTFLNREYHFKQSDKKFEV